MAADRVLDIPLGSDCHTAPATKQPKRSSG
jgi:hypothetical protein